MSWLVDFNYSWWGGWEAGFTQDRVQTLSKTHAQVHRDFPQPLTSSAPRRARRRWGIRAVRGVSAPPLLWPCTLMWSSIGTGDPEPSRTPRWGLSPLQKVRPCLWGWLRCCCSSIKKLDLGEGRGAEEREPCETHLNSFNSFLELNKWITCGYNNNQTSWVPLVISPHKILDIL